MVKQIPRRAQTTSDLVLASSSAAIEETFSRLNRRFRIWGRWLTVRHPYRNVVRAINPKNKSLDGKLLAEYIAGSIPLHLMDGWVFLSRALDAVKLGDHNTAAHLGYYAELRAAMSLLASEGIGIFNRKHVAINSSFVPTTLHLGTHPATWKLLKSWGADQTRAITLLDSISVESRTIREWFDEAKISSSAQIKVAREWLKVWSLDLSIFDADHELRNNISYRPSRITANSPSPLDLDVDVIDPVMQTWLAVEPSGDSGGAVIDRILLYRALRLASNQSSDSGWQTVVNTRQGIASDSLIDQLRNESKNSSYTLNVAGDSSEPPPVPAILARATLLLRLANGACALRLRNSRTTREDIRFWWKRVGEDFGLWTDEADADPFSDLWAGVDESLSDTQDNLDLVGIPKTITEITAILSTRVPLTQYSRAPLWLLGVD